MRNIFVLGEKETAKAAKEHIIPKGWYHDYKTAAGENVFELIKIITDEKEFFQELSPEMKNLFPNAKEPSLHFVPEVHLLEFSYTVDFDIISIWHNAEDKPERKILKSV
jgi:hypothetical protein